MNENQVVGVHLGHDKLRVEPVVVPLHVSGDVGRPV